MNTHTDREFLTWQTQLFITTLVLFLSIGAAGIFLFERSENVLQNEHRQQLIIAAATSARIFQSTDIDAIRGPADMDTTVFHKLIDQLSLVRDALPEATYVYLLRKTDDPMQLEFIADADALESFEEQDANNNGIIDPDEEGSYPGDLYDITDVPALQEEAFREPTADKEVTYDQWGALISGYAPIFRDDGTVAGVLGIDMSADFFEKHTRQIITPTGLFSVVFVAGLIAFVVMHVLIKRRVAYIELVEKERSAFIRLALHQLGAPLAIFRWWTDLLRGNPKMCMVDDVNVCDEFDSSIQRMNSILESLRTASDVTNNSVHYTPRLTSLRSLISKQIKESDNILKIRQQNISVRIDKNTPAKVRIDPLYIGHVLHVLIDNAISYSPPKTNISIHVHTKGKNLTIAVEDNGIGISRNDVSKIFKRFTRTKEAEQMKPIGTGVGLYIAREIIESIGGEILVESTTGKGSTFTIVLPYDKK